MIQIQRRVIPPGGARQFSVRKRRGGLTRQPDVLSRIRGEIGSVDPEAEEGVSGSVLSVVDENLRDVDFAEEGFVVGC